jgi:hypothetical protein
VLRKPNLLLLLDKDKVELAQESEDDDKSDVDNSTYTE